MRDGITESFCKFFDRVLELVCRMKNSRSSCISFVRSIENILHKSILILRNSRRVSDTKSSRSSYDRGVLKEKSRLLNLRCTFSIHLISVV